MMCPTGSSKVRMPDFICVGAQKSGTSWLYEQLRFHPQVSMKRKEYDHFFRSTDRDLYAKNFEDTPPGMICGDVSPNYAAFEEVAERIADVCPDVKILHILRDPVERAFSQWKMARNLGNIPRDAGFIGAFRNNMQYMRRRGEYATIIQEYARFFPLNARSAVFWYSDISQRPADLLERIMSFIQIDPTWRSPRLADIVWPSPEPGQIRPDEAAEVGRYYEPFNDELRALLGVRQLPWDS